MLAATPAVLLFLAQAATANPAQGAPSAYGPTPAPPPPTPAGVAKPQDRQCAPQPKGANGGDIVVCAVKPEGYRLPPDIVEARKLKKQGEASRPRSPHESFADHSCATIGPMGCRGTPTIDLIAVAATAAEISKRMAKGQEVGSVFETEPHSSDYQYFEEAKKLREAKEAQARAAAVKAKALTAKAAADAAKAQSAPSN